MHTLIKRYSIVHLTLHMNSLVEMVKIWMVQQLSDDIVARLYVDNSWTKTSHTKGTSSNSERIYSFEEKL